MDTSGFGFAKDVKTQKAESSEFPTLCETCLGPNPLIRMLKEKAGKTCRICDGPFTMFRWKPGPKARYKQTIICQNCSRIKNVCQTCLFDLEYGLPVQVRDEFVKNGVNLADAKVNLNYQINKVETGALEIPDNVRNPTLEKLARIAPYYRRNKPRVCTFWLKGACNRGSECPYLHEKETHDPALSKQNIRDRYKGQNDPLALQILAKVKAGAIDQSDDPSNPSDRLPDGVYLSMTPQEAQKHRAT
ncbi:bifunctional Pre-mRNA-splicing factor Cwc2-Slt11/Zinc finger [Babesia duncani]|uniref:Bifunctional Pre-mRNA-splicing factor Cwc2-Slt11/Zinc finger n=1 Tax=Babesia duncani TaxID=323732 RepID=A0AAD9UQE9_9APIC|nr:bifunctional Pre-mRNA-splicing factor Cwc2-Slt11/Zinc finger [Babesia duncani]